MSNLPVPGYQAVSVKCRTCNNWVRKWVPYTPTEQATFAVREEDVDTCWTCENGTGPTWQLSPYQLPPIPWGLPHTIDEARQSPALDRVAPGLSPKGDSSTLSQIGQSRPSVSQTNRGSSQALMSQECPTATSESQGRAPHRDEQKRNNGVPAPANSESNLQLINITGDLAVEGMQLRRRTHGPRFPWQEAEDAILRQICIEHESWNWVSITTGFNNRAWPNLPQRWRTMAAIVHRIRFLGIEHNHDPWNHGNAANGV